MMASCRTCHGSKVQPGTDGWCCETCGGSGLDPDIALDCYEEASLIWDETHCADCGRPIPTTRHLCIPCERAEASLLFR